MTDAEMGNFTEDVRTKLTAEDHAFLSAVALGRREEIATILRRLVREYLEAKRHEYTVAARFATAKGISAEPGGNGA